MDCNTCGIPTDNRCSRCDKALYCGPDCQRAHWESHRDECKDNQLEKALQRVAEILHAAYLTFRQNTWHVAIGKMEVTKDPEDGADILTVTDADRKMNMRYFAPFPKKLVKDNPELRMTLLSSWHCNEPFAHFHQLIMKLLNGLNIDIHEIAVSLHRVKWKVAAVMRGDRQMVNHPVMKHGLLRLMSRRTGKMWVIDLCGAQYGNFQPLHEWREYQELFKAILTSVWQPGFAKTLYDELAAARGNPAIAFGLPNIAATALDKMVGKWEKRHNALSRLRTIDYDEYKKKKKSLLRHLDEAVSTHVKKMDLETYVETEVRFEKNRKKKDKSSDKMGRLSDAANLLPESEVNKAELANLAYRLEDMLKTASGGEYDSLDEN